MVSGLVVLIVSLTGCIYCFQEEISDVVFHDAFYVHSTGPVHPVSEMQATAQKALGDERPVNFITTYRDDNRAWEFMAYRLNDTAVTYFGALPYFQSVFIDPHTGRITGSRDYKYDFFNVVKYLHWSLLLNTKYGQPVVGYATLIFVILLITGLVLWYPRKWNRATRRQAFTIRRNASFKRLNYDLHNVPGFYSFLIALVLGATGLVFSFTWFSSAVYAAASGSFTPPPQTIVQSDTTAFYTSAQPIDIAYRSALAGMPQARRIGIEPADGKAGVIEMFGYASRSTYYEYDELRFDRYSGKQLYRRNYNEKNRGEKLIAMNYDIHVGAIWGLPGKIIAFIVSLIAASLPVTGFIIWWGKRKKKKKK